MLGIFIEKIIYWTGVSSMGGNSIHTAHFPFSGHGTTLAQKHSALAVEYQIRFIWF